MTLTDSHKPSASEWERPSLKHRIAHRSDPPTPHPPFDTQRWAWHLTKARLYDSPNPASRPKGPVVWTTFTPVNPPSDPITGSARPTHEPQPPPPAPLTGDGARWTGTATHVPDPPRVETAPRPTLIPPRRHRQRLQPAREISPRLRRPHSSVLTHAPVPRWP